MTEGTERLLASIVRARPALLREPILREDLDATSRCQPTIATMDAVKRWRRLLASGDVDAVIAALEGGDEYMRAVCPLHVLLLTPRGEL